MDKIVSTNEFWMIMDHPMASLVTMKHLECLGDHYYCSNPPDSDFLSRVLDGIEDEIQMDNLKHKVMMILEFE